jgi:hypothetical protein
VVALTLHELDRSASDTLPVLAIEVVATAFAGGDARTEAHSCGRTRERGGSATPQSRDAPGLQLRPAARWRRLLSTPTGLPRTQS